MSRKVIEFGCMSSWSGMFIILVDFLNTVSSLADVQVNRGFFHLPFLPCPSHATHTAVIQQKAKGGRQLAAFFPLLLRRGLSAVGWLGEMSREGNNDFPGRRSMSVHMCRSLKRLNVSLAEHQSENLEMLFPCFWSSTSTSPRFPLWLEVTVRPDTCFF